MRGISLTSSFTSPALRNGANKVVCEKRKVGESRKKEKKQEQEEEGGGGEEVG